VETSVTTLPGFDCLREPIIQAEETKVDNRLVSLRVQPQMLNALYFWSVQVSDHSSFINYSSILPLDPCLVMIEPTNKKRRLDDDLKRQDSFSAVLEQLEAEEDASGGMSTYTDYRTFNR
jgi:hypothetical protein